MRQCTVCGKEFEPKTANHRACSRVCKSRADMARRKNPDLDTLLNCAVCGTPFKPYRSGQKNCTPECGGKAWRANRKGEQDSAPPLTRRCRSKDCIERFVPVNDQHWFHEPACRLSERLWDVEDILREEGSLLPQAGHMELAKRAFGQKNQALRENTRLRSLRDYLTFEVQTFHDEHPEYRYPKVPSPPRDVGKKGDREVLIQCSDWQVGKWEAGFGVDGTMARVDRLMQATASIVQRQRDAGYRVRRIIPSFGGDMIEGCFIYRGQNVSGLDRTGNTHRLTQQIRQTAYKMAEFVTFCGTLAEKVDVQVVGGNHGRPNGPNDYADPEDNFDVMAGWWASDLTVKSKHISWSVHENWWGGFEVAGQYVVSLHGDQWQGPFMKLETLLPQWVTAGVFGPKPAVVLTHHRHEERQMEVGGIPIFQNGCIDGGSGWYLRSFGKASRPFQRIMTFSDKYVPESQWPVYFSDLVSGALVA